MGSRSDATHARQYGAGSLDAVFASIIAKSDHPAALASRVVNSHGADTTAIEELETMADRADAPTELLRSVAMAAVVLGRWGPASRLFEKIAAGPAVKSVANDMRTLAWMYNATDRFSDMLLVPCRGCMARQPQRQKIAVKSPTRRSGGRAMPRRKRHCSRPSGSRTRTWALSPAGAFD
jgi:hypothetical protein